MSQFSGKVLLRGRRMSEITACDFTPETEEFLVTVTTICWIYYLVFNGVFWSQKSYLLESDSISFSVSFLFTWISKNTHYKFGLCLVRTSQVLMWGYRLYDIWCCHIHGYFEQYFVHKLCIIDAFLFSFTFQNKIG